jgi:hypothetical protein
MCNTYVYIPAYNFLKLLSYTLEGFDLATHSSGNLGDTTRQRRQGNTYLYIYVGT